MPSATERSTLPDWPTPPLQLLLESHGGETFVLCTGIPEDRAIGPAAVPAAVTAGRNLVVLEAVEERDQLVVCLADTPLVTIVNDLRRRVGGPG